MRYRNYHFNSVELINLDLLCFIELANTMKYGGGVLYNLVFTEWRHCVSQNEVWGEGVLYNPVFTEWRHLKEEGKWTRGAALTKVTTLKRHVDLLGFFSNQAHQRIFHGTYRMHFNKI